MEKVNDTGGVETKPGFIYYGPKRGPQISDEVVIKLCPFCGGKAKLKPAGFYIHVECTICHARGKQFNTDTSDYTHDAPAEAIKAWNKRADPEHKDGRFFGCKNCEVVWATEYEVVGK